jgi:hypothetical protein
LFERHEGKPDKARVLELIGQPAGTRVKVMSLATAWSAAGPFGPSLDPRAAERPAALRESIIEAVRLLANAGKGASIQGRSTKR